MSIALIKIDTGQVIDIYGDGPPSRLTIEGVVDVHCPPANWTMGVYKFVPVVYMSNPPSNTAINTGSVQAVSNSAVTITSTYAEPTPPSLDDLKASLCVSVDKKAEQVRLKYITPGAGQMGVYILKYDEAKRVLADPSPVANNYPLNAASIGLPGITTITESAQSAVTQYEQWIGVAAAVENVRLVSKASINAANTVSAAQTIFDTIDWMGL